MHDDPYHQIILDDSLDKIGFDEELIRKKKGMETLKTVVFLAFSFAGVMACIWGFLGVALFLWSLGAIAWIIKTLGF